MAQPVFVLMVGKGSIVNFVGVKLGRNNSKNGFKHVEIIICKYLLNFKCEILLSENYVLGYVYQFGSLHYEVGTFLRDLLCEFI